MTCQGASAVTCQGLTLRGSWDEREDSLPPFSRPPAAGPSDGGVSAWGAHILAHRAGAPLAARTGGQCSSRVGLASYARLGDT